MNKKGFTLIELLVTIALIGLVGIVVSVNMVKIVNNQKDKDIEQAKALVEEAACAYAGLSTSNVTPGTSVSANTLIEAGLLDEVINGHDVSNYQIEVSESNGERFCNIID